MSASEPVSAARRQALERPSGLRGRIPKQTRLGGMLRLDRMVNQRSIRDVAKEIGIGHATLLRIEIGQGMDAATLLKVWTWLLGAK